MKKRIISSVILASMLLSLAACSKDVPDAKDTTDTTVTVGDILPAGIEQKDYKGTVNILMPDWGLYQNYFDPGDDMTDIMNKALFNRELKVEEYLGVDITYDHIPTIYDIAPALSTAISTNDDLYQIVLTHCINGNSGFITSGYLADMNEMDIDFTDEWFNQSANEALSVYGKQYFCISDYNLPDPNVFLFNKSMIDELNLEDPYQLVRDGKWTIDKMCEMASVATADNGDTVWDVNDTYGFSCPGTWYTNSFIFSADIPFIEKNEDGDFYLAFDNERAYTLLEKMDALINGPDTYYFDDRGLNGDAAFVDKALPIESDRCLFTLYALNMLYKIRNVETDFGILPYPKLDEEQENYISNDWTGLMCVPMSLKLESYYMVGDVIELLAYHSEEEVIPTYIDTTLGTKLSRDDESKEMIDLVFDTCSFNAGMNYFGFDTTGPFYMFQIIHEMLYRNGSNTLSSWMATYGPPANSSITAFNNAVRELGE